MCTFFRGTCTHQVSMLAGANAVSVPSFSLTRQSMGVLLSLLGMSRQTDNEVRLLSENVQKVQLQQGSMTYQMKKFIKCVEQLMESVGDRDFDAAREAKQVLDEVKDNTSVASRALLVPVSGSVNSSDTRAPTPHPTAIASPLFFKRLDHARHICHFLAGTAHFQLVLGHGGASAQFSRTKANDALVAFSDPDFAGCPDTCRCVAGIVVFFLGSAILMEISEDTLSSESSLSGAIVAASSVQVPFCRGLLDEFGYEIPSTRLMGDSSAAVGILQSDKVDSIKTKY
jgi:hypothetical protein